MSTLNGTIQALDKAGWAAGTVLIGEPKDTSNPLACTLDLSSGKITSRGLLFVPPSSQVAILSSTLGTSSTGTSAFQIHRSLLGTDTDIAWVRGLLGGDFRD